MNYQDLLNLRDEPELRQAIFSILPDEYRYICSPVSFGYAALIAGKVRPVWKTYKGAVGIENQEAVFPIPLFTGFIENWHGPVEIERPMNTPCLWKQHDAESAKNLCGTVLRQRFTDLEFYCAGVSGKGAYLIGEDGSCCIPFPCLLYRYLTADGNPAGQKQHEEKA